MTVQQAFHKLETYIVQAPGAPDDAGALNALEYLRQRFAEMQVRQVAAEQERGLAVASARLHDAQAFAP